MPSITAVDPSSLSRSERRLLSRARDAALKAYCPYSKFPVGAAISTASGAIYTGCNIESCSFGATICAERVAAVKAVSEGHRSFKAIAVVAPAAPPEAGSCGCGLCRQFLAEFGLNLVFIKARNDGKIIRATLAELLPQAFTPAIVVPGRSPVSDLRSLRRSIVACLSPDLLKRRYRGSPCRVYGHCYVATEALYHLLGGAGSGYVGQVVRHEGTTHWYLRHRDSGKVVDLTSRQFKTPVPYKLGRGCGFLTRQPSRRAAVLIERVRERMGSEYQTNKTTAGNS